jgi:hypothetical protein
VKIYLLSLVFMITVAVSTCVRAQETPGSVWNTFGTSPVESGNVVDMFHVGQGVIVGHVGTVEVVPYVAFNASTDSQKLSWNNKIEVEGGVKLNKNFENGYVDLGIAYGTERIYTETDSFKSTIVMSSSGWFGYQASNKYDTPGTVMWELGNNSPSDESNTIGEIRVEQGYNFLKGIRSSAGIVGWGQLGFDTQNRSWNNRAITGGGFRLTIPTKNSNTNITFGYECISTFSDGTNLCGPTIELDVWAGWKNIKGGV